MSPWLLTQLTWGNALWWWDTGMSEVIISASGFFASLAALRRENSCHDLTQQAKGFQMLANDCLQSSHVLCWSFCSKPQNTLLANESSPRQVLSLVEEKSSHLKMQDFRISDSTQFHKISSLLFELWVPPFTESGSCLLAAQWPTCPKHLNLEMIKLSRIVTGVTRSSRMYQCNPTYQSLNQDASDKTANISFLKIQFQRLRLPASRLSITWSMAACQNMAWDYQTLKVPETSSMNACAWHES